MALFLADFFAEKTFVCTLPKLMADFSRILSPMNG